MHELEGVGWRRCDGRLEAREPNRVVSEAHGGWSSNDETQHEARYPAAQAMRSLRADRATLSGYPCPNCCTYQESRADPIAAYLHERGSSSRARRVAPPSVENQLLD